MFSDNTKILNSLVEVIAEANGKNFVTLVDVGAAQGEADRWQPFGPLIKVVGFEPNTTEFSKLVGTDSEVWINCALSGRSESRPIYLTKYWSNSSLLRPNKAVIDTLAWGDGHEIVREDVIECQSLDDVLSARGLGLDILKVDTQGAELEVLHGAGKSLSAAVAVEVEVEFLPLYDQQPLFAEVDVFLRERQFHLQDLGNILYMKPRQEPETGGPKGRIISADALYFRDPRSAPVLASDFGDKKVAALFAAYLAYGYPELVCCAVQALEAAGMAQAWHQTSSRLARAIMHPSKRFAWLGGKNFLARFGRVLWQNFYRFHGSLWDHPLGNKLR